MGGSGDGEMPEGGKFQGNLPVFEPGGLKSKGESGLDDDPLFAEGKKGPLFQEEKEGGVAKERAAGQRPDFRVVQPEHVPALGKTVYKDVGAMWRNVSKGGNEFYTLKIGKLKLLVFPNNK